MMATMPSARAEDHAIAHQAAKALTPTIRALDHLPDIELIGAAGDVLNFLRTTVIDSLSERRAMAVRRLSADGMKLEEIAAAAGLSRQRIHQMLER